MDPTHLDFNPLDPTNSKDNDLNLQKATVSILLSFVPNLLVAQILKSPWDPGHRLPCTSQWCAAAFIDISGFSSLASDLQSKDKAKGK